VNNIEPFTDMQIKKLLEDLLDQAEESLSRGRVKGISTDFFWLMSKSEEPGSFIHTCRAVDRDPYDEQLRLLEVYYNKVYHPGQTAKLKRLAIITNIANLRGMH